jgi:hypothetical protein
MSAICTHFDISENLFRRSIESVQLKVIYILIDRILDLPNLMILLHYIVIWISRKTVGPLVAIRSPV